MDQAIAVLLQNGLSGVAIVILLFVIKNLYNQNSELQEKRIAEMQKNILIIEQNKVALETLTQILKVKDGRAQT